MATLLDGSLQDMRGAVGPFSAFEASQTQIEAGGTEAAGERGIGARF